MACAARQLQIHCSFQSCFPLGLDDFSVSAPSVLRTRKTIAAWTKAEADELTARVSGFDTAAEVKALLERKLAKF